MDSGMGSISVTDHTASGLEEASVTAAFERSATDVMLVAPYFRFVGERGRRSLVVGQAQVTASRPCPVEIVVNVRAVWSETLGWRQEARLPDGVADEVIADLPEPASAPSGDPASAVVRTAKTIAEAARNEVLRLRGLRYELEQHLADLLAKRGGGALRPLLAQIIEISVAAGRARDQAQEAARDGLWLWLWDSDTYHRTRAGTEAEPAWQARYRAAIGHCEAMDTQLAEEVSRLHSLLSSMSTFAVAQDGEAQERFNLLAAVAAAGLGLPALILSFYGADAYLPLNSFDHMWRALVPIGATVLLAVGVALRWLPGRTGPRHYTAAAVLVLSLLSILLFAGALAPGQG